MIKEEFKNLLNHKILLVSITVIMIIPFLYSVFFLKSVWDPYGNVKHLPVAVVNEDKSVKFRGKTIDVGDQFVSELKKNHDLDWHFLSAKDAEYGLRHKKYYMVLTIPKNFSHNASTILDNQPKKMEIKYRTNDSLNYLGKVISEQGAKQVNDVIRDNVSKEYATAIFKEIDKIGGKMTQAANGAKQLADGTVKLSDGINKYTAGVAQVGDGLMTLQTKIGPLTEGVDKLVEGSNKLVIGSDKVADGLSQVNAKTGTLAAGAKQLSEGLNTLNDKTGQLADGANKLADGLNTLNGKTGALAAGVAQLQKGSHDYNEAIIKYTTGVYQVYSGIQKVADNLTKLKADGTEKAKAGASELKTGAFKYTAGVKAIAVGMGALDLSVNTGDLVGKMQKLNEGMQELNKGLKTLNGTSSQIEAGSKKLTKGTADMKQLVAVAKRVRALNKTLKAVVDNPKPAADKMPTGMPTQAEIQAVQATLTELIAVQKRLTQTNNDLKASNVKLDELAQAQTDPAAKAAIQAIVAKNKQTIAANDGAGVVDTTKTVATLKVLNDVYTKVAATKPQDNKALKVLAKQANEASTQLAASLEPAVNNLNAGATALDQGINQYTQGVAKARVGSMKLALGTKLLVPSTKLLAGSIAKINQGLQTLSTKGTELYAGTSKLYDGVAKIDENVGKLAEGTTKVAAGAKALNDKAPALKAGSAKIADGIATLNNNVPALVAGVSQLNAGGQKLKASMPALVAGVSQLNAGGQKLNAGVPVLVNAIEMLNAGSQQVAGGQHALNEGLNQLHDKVPMLAAGVNKLAEGGQKLVSKTPELKAGTNKLAAGNNELATKLQAGADKLGEIELTKRTAEMLANPTKLKESHYSEVPNYGYALAPYMLSVALYVGALVFNFIYPIRRLSTPDGSATSWFFSKVLIGTTFAVLAGLAETGLMMLCGLHPEHVGSFLMNAVAFSMTATFTVMFFSIAFENPGRFIAMILLIIQLGSCGGSFPIEITKGMNGLFEAINPYLPMTYSVYGFRQALTSGLGSSQMMQTYAVQLGYIVVLLILIWIAMLYLRRSGKVTYMEDFRTREADAALEDE
ncbi:YhgE/Pip family protein [Ligilactobacillus ceti]|nr:YhgE/Pip family protein [Ligilactobacillus ceti]